MARTESRTKTSIWDDDEFTSLSGAAQRMYWLLYSQATINLCGVVALTMKKWARKSRDGSVEGVEADLKELEATGYILVDWDTEEVCVRTFIHHDGVARSPKTLTAARGQVSTISSATIRASVMEQFALLDTPPDTPPPGPNGGGNTHPDTPSGTPADTPSDTHPDRTRAYAHADSSLRLQSPSPVSDTAAPGGASLNPTHRLANLLADLIGANGSKRPNVTRSWLEDIEAILAERLPDDVEAVVRYSQADGFWRANVLNSAQLRKNYDRLRLQGQRPATTSRLAVVQGGQRSAGGRLAIEELRQRDGLGRTS